MQYQKQAKLKAEQVKWRLEFSFKLIRFLI
jgi:hypothetical protein